MLFKSELNIIKIVKEVQKIPMTKKWIPELRDSCQCNT